ncbi:hypothetical protein HYPSUDRAFT_201276 [Hypholoma sublateritium FD-334 SS-4]|uniref:F-box domain-containing protein n=1 Tax=Hypholoma sublateritium (strain FD-334 SS-4) TaxID=945553 RepID=A0A0D2MIQ4_HYPSF|nr:hypothetical protein HYPSUDRAFT_201276 [Hypholoma sublateritium FD-334 SS-4]
MTSSSVPVEVISPPSTPRLTDLPVELLTEILKRTTWKDILNLRKTCSLLSDVTRGREVWAHHVREYIAGMPQRPPRLERPIETYISGELEHLLLVWRSAELGWMAKGGKPVRERSIMVEPAEYVHLIQGGRWLLVTTNTCEVTYYDLNTENIEGVVLIPQQIHKPLLIDKKMTIDVDLSAPTLSFRVAFSIIDNSVMENDPAGRKATIQIWGITLLFNGVHAIGLSARRLALLHHQSEISTVLALSLLGPTVAFNALFFDGGLYTIVFEWEKAEDTSATCPWRVLKPPSNVVSVVINALKTQYL